MSNAKSSEVAQRPDVKNVYVDEILSGLLSWGALYKTVVEDKYCGDRLCQETQFESTIVNGNDVLNFGTAT